MTTAMTTVSNTIRNWNADFCDPTKTTRCHASYEHKKR